MRSDELRRAIEGPARAAGLRLEAGLVDAMLADVEGEPGALPLLSHALYESWARRDGRVLTLAGYRAAGGVRGAIAHTAEEVFLGCSPQRAGAHAADAPPADRAGRGDGGHPSAGPAGGAGPGGRGPQGPRPRCSSGWRAPGSWSSDDDSAEIAHEALIREWPRLRGWLAEDRDELRALRQLTTAARSWEESGRDDADLYRGPRLAAAVELAVAERQLSASSASSWRRAGTPRTRELRTRGAAPVACGSCSPSSRRRWSLAVIAGAFALVQRGSARRTATVAQAGRLAAQSREVAAQHPDLGLLLALEAGRLDDSVDSRGALLGALEHGSRIRAWLQGFDSPVVATAFSPERNAPGDGDASTGPRSGTRRHGSPSARRCDRRRAARRGSTSAPTGGRWRSRAERAASSCGTCRPGRSFGS